MKQLFRYSPQWVQPVFGITPETFNTVDMITSHRKTATLANHHVVAAERQRRVGLPVIGEVQTTRLGIHLYQLHHCLTIAAGYWKNPHLTIPFQNAKHDHFATGSPPSFALPTAAKHRFIQFQIAIKGFHTLLIQGHDHPTVAVEPIQSRAAGNPMKTEPIHRNAQAEIIQNLTLGSLTDPETLPDGSARVPVTALATLATPIR